MKNKYQYQRINGKKDRVHRHIMIEHLGRDLDKNEHVYHLNGDKSDNSLENLVIVKKNTVIKWSLERKNE